MTQISITTDRYLTDEELSFMRKSDLYLLMHTIVNEMGIARLREDWGLVMSLLFYKCRVEYYWRFNHNMSEEK